MVQASRLAVLAVLCGLLCGRLEAAPLKLIDEHGNAVAGDGPVEITPTVEMPRDVIRIVEGKLFEVRKKYDVVVLAVWQKYGCETCGQMLKDFAATARNPWFAGKAIAFTTLDVAEEADEFHLLMSENPDYEWFVPALLILKHDLHTVRKKPPFSFLLSDRTGLDLPKFLFRLLGPDFTSVGDDAALATRVAHDATERVSFALYADFCDAALRHAVEQVAVEERLHVFFSEVTSQSLLATTDALVARFNPSRAGFVAFVASADGTGVDQVLPFVVPRSGNGLFNALREFIAHAKTHRPGHEFDRITKVTTVDSRDSDCTGKLVSRLRDRLRVQVTGTNLHTGAIFRPPSEVTVDAGMARHDLPSTLPKSAFVGLCEGSKRTIAFPAQSHFQEGSLPIHVDAQDIIKFDVLILDVTPLEQSAGGDL